MVTSRRKWILKNGLLVASTVLAIPRVAFPQVVLTGRKDFRFPSSTASGKASFSDDFNRADSDSMGANWTEWNGDWDIAGNKASSPQTFDFSNVIAAYTGTSCTTVEQYCKFTATGGVVIYPGVVFRATDASSPLYVVYTDIQNNLFFWVSQTSASSAQTIIGSVSHTMTSPMTIGFTISGTGNSTVVRIWISPTGNAPTTAALWDGSGPTYSITDDPGSPVNTGNKIGIFSLDASGAVTIDGFFGGDIP